MFLNMWTWKLGTGHRYTWPAAQWWFGLQDPPDQWGVAAYHWYTDPALSPDGSKLAMTDSETDDSQLLLAATHGPAWSGEPPYAEVDYVNPQSDLNPPTIECETPRGKYTNPSWSRDGKLLAYGTADGVHVMSVPSLECGQITERLLVPGGVDPAFGSADVDMAQAPRPGGSSAPAGHGATARISGLALHPAAFRATRPGGTRVSYRLTAAGRVTLTVTSAGGRRIKGAAVSNGKAGRNTLRFSGRIGGKALRRGRYRLVLTPAGGAPVSAKFRIVR
jgi:Tol biopolymer transport system component